MFLDNFKISDSNSPKQKNWTPFTLTLRGNLFKSVNSLMVFLVTIALQITTGVCSKSKPLKFRSQQIDSDDVNIKKS